MDAPDDVAFSYDEYESFFRNTTRRWIYDEQERLAERYVRFNVAALMRIVARAVGRNRCVNMSKLAEGGFNKIFLLTMDDGYEAIARIPMPIAGTSGLTTASEVATMDYLRNHLHIPVPRVFWWDSRLDESNSVGAEYIVMEKIQGDTLGQRWLSLSTRELGEVIREIVEFESRLFSAAFPKFGSLYYTEHLEEKLRVNEIEGKFCVGPLADNLFWKEERDQMTLDRGPWLHPEDYLRSLALREAAWTSEFGKPRLRQFYTSFSTHDIEPKEHVRLLAEYGLVAPHLIPRKDPFLSSPILRHPDLHLSNIILRPNSTKIAGIIDWQGASILPFFIQSGFPVLCRHHGDLPEKLETPKLPDKFKQMTLDQQTEAWTKLTNQNAVLFYTSATLLKCHRHMTALKLPHLVRRQNLIKQASVPWNGDLVPFRDALTNFRAVWDEIVPTQPYPYLCTLTNEEKQINRLEIERWRKDYALLARVREILRVDRRGGTSLSNFDRARGLNLRYRLEALQQCPEMQDFLWKHWPYKDKSDDSSPPALY